MGKSADHRAGCLFSSEILEFLWEIQRLGHIVLGKGLGSALGAMATPH